MLNQNYSIIAFLKETDDGVSFPFLPEQIWDDCYDIYCINYDTIGPDTEKMDAASTVIHIPACDVDKQGNIADILASLIHSDGMDQRKVFTVHPNNILLPIYKWYLLRHGVTMFNVEQFVQRLSRVTVDICDAFHKPAILTLDRRQNFNYKTIARWLNFNPEGTTKKDQCLSTLRYICHRL
jgi:hypothetical protein